MSPKASLGTITTPHTTYSWNAIVPFEYVTSVGYPNVELRAYQDSVLVCADYRWAGPDQLSPGTRTLGPTPSIDYSKGGRGVLILYGTIKGKPGSSVAEVWFDVSTLP